MKDPAFLFYFRDFMVGTEGMSLSERGAYISLMCVQAENGYITDRDMKKICSDICFDTMQVTLDEKVYKSVKMKFAETEKGSGQYINSRLNSEIEKRVKYSESRRNNRNQKKETTYEKDMSEHMNVHMVNGNENRNINTNKEGVQGEKKTTAKKTNDDHVHETSVRPHHTEVHDAGGRFVSSRTCDVRTLISPELDQIEFEKMCMRDGHTMDGLKEIFALFCDKTLASGELLTRKEALSKLHSYSFNQKSSRLVPINGKKVNGSARPAMVYKDED